MPRQDMKKLIINISLLVIVLLACSIMVEVSFRLFFPQSHLAPVIAFDEDLGWRLKPSQELSIRNYYDLDRKPKIKTFHTNSQGFWDDETPFENKEGEKRILSLGDSMTIALAVKKHERYTEVMEKELANAGYSINVINTGIGSYGTYQEMAYYFLEGYKYNPDIVIIGFLVSNDIYDNCDPSRGISFTNPEEGHFTPIIKKKTAPKKYSPSILINKLHTYRFLTKLSYQPTLRRLLSRLGIVKVSTEEYLDLFRKDSTGRIDDCIEETITYLNAFREILANRQAELVILIIPDMKQVNPEEFDKYIISAGENPETGFDALKVNKAILGLRKEGVHIVDMLPVMLEQENKDFHFVYDTHWNNNTHSTAGKTLARYILESGLLKE